MSIKYIIITLLIKNLSENFDIPPYLVIFLTDYLANRKQYVSFGGADSRFYDVPCGVPQGAILSPPMFVLFINDLPALLEGVNVFLYADDIKIWKEITSNQDVFILQNNIDLIEDWAIDNKMNLHPDKCEIMHYGNDRVQSQYRINKRTLKTTSEITDLGVVFDRFLSFKDHIMLKQKKAFQILGFVKRTSFFLRNANTISLLYNALVRSIVEYASPVWNPQQVSLIKLIEKIQKNFLRFLYFKKHNAPVHYLRNPVSYLELLDEFNFLSLEKRRIVTDCIFVFNIMNNLADCPMLVELIAFKIGRPNIRRNDLFEIPLAKRSLFLNSPLVRILSFLNSATDLDLFGASKSSFKKATIEGLT